MIFAIRLFICLTKEIVEAFKDNYELKITIKYF